MISEVMISGRLGAHLSPTMRYVEIDRVISTPTGGKYEVDKVPVKAYGGKESRFMKAKEGALIVLKGRLETKSDLGVYVISEFHEIFSPLER